MRARRVFTTALVALVATGSLALAGCSNDPLAEQYRAGSGKNYIAGDGSITEIALANRGEPIAYSGTTLTGQPASSQDSAGKVQVINFWYAGCAPCRAEAKDLESVYAATKGKGVSFLGVNVRDGNDTALAFNKTFGVTYPSVSDLNGKLQLAFASNVPANAVPTTLILDKQGRVAARILGRLSDPSILTTLIDDQLKAAP